MNTVDMRMSPRRLWEEADDEWDQGEPDFPEDEVPWGESTDRRIEAGRTGETGEGGRRKSLD